jgi:hypothetical protein
MKQILTLAACIVATTCVAQSKKFEFKLGSEYGLPKKTEDLSFFGNEKDGIVNLSLKKEQLYITRFNPKTLTQTDERVIELPEATRNMVSETVVDFDNSYYWLRSDWDKDRQKEFLYATRIDVKNGKLDSKDQKLIEANKMGSDGYMPTGWYRAKKVGKYGFDYDADRKKLLVNYRLIPEDRRDKNNYDRLGIHVFDENMQKLWSNEFTMPYTEKRMDNEDFAIDANGNAYLLAKVYDSESRKEKDKAGNPSYHLEVFKFTQNSEQAIHARISLDQYFIQETSLIENAMHDMVIACTYSKTAKGKGTEGIFLGILNTEGKVSNYKKGYYKFPVEELQKFESRRKQRKIEKNDDYEAPNLTVRNIIVEKDGSVLLACEEYYITSTTHYSSGPGGTMGSSGTTVVYHYDDILASKIDASGNFLWTRKIPKRQQGTRGRGTMSFKLISDETGYYFLYLDNKKNEKMDDNDTPAKHVDGAGGQVMEAKIDNSGKVTKEIVFNTREEDIMIFPAAFHKINNNQFIGRAKVKKNLFQPLLITMKK